MILGVSKSDVETGEARCPRCGYDLRGVVGAWESSCPLEGVCSECGLAVRWAEVLRPEKFAPWWCVESVPRLRAVPLSASATMLRSFRPWTFWRELKMSQRIRWGRLGMYVVLLFVLPVIVGYVVEQSAVALHVRWQKGQELRECRQHVTGRIRSIQLLVESPQWPARPAMERQALQSELQSLDTALAAPVSVNHGYAAAWLEAVFTPTARTSAGTINTFAGRQPYPAPRQLHGELRISGTVWGGNLTDRLLEWAPLAAWWIAAQVLLPVCFVCLPISRRRAKVRWRHLARIALYGLFIPWAIVFAMLLCITVALASPRWDGVALGAASLLLFLMIPATVAWWVAAISRYLRMPHAWAVAVLLTVVAVLFPLTAIVGVRGWM